MKAQKSLLFLVAVQTAFTLIGNEVPHSLKRSVCMDSGQQVPLPTKLLKQSSIPLNQDSDKHAAEVAHVLTMQKIKDPLCIHLLSCPSLDESLTERHARAINVARLADSVQDLEEKKAAYISLANNIHSLLPDKSWYERISWLITSTELSKVNAPLLSGLPMHAHYQFLKGSIITLLRKQSSVKCINNTVDTFLHCGGNASTLDYNESKGSYYGVFIANLAFYHNMPGLLARLARYKAHVHISAVLCPPLLKDAPTLSETPKGIKRYIEHFLGERNLRSVSCLHTQHHLLITAFNTRSTTLPALRTLLIVPSNFILEPVINPTQYALYDIAPFGQAIAVHQSVALPQLLCTKDNCWYLHLQTYLTDQATSQLDDLIIHAHLGNALQQFPS